MHKLVSRKLKNLYNNWTSPAFESLIFYGVHIGHSYRNSNNYCSWMVFGIREGVFLINLYKFMYMLRAGFFVLNSTVRSLSPIWFVNLDATAYLHVKHSALSCGEYWVTSNWISGLITNYSKMKKAINGILRSEMRFWNRKLFSRSEIFFNWVFTRETWPTTLFVSNVKVSQRACREANAKSISCIGIADTDAFVEYVNLAIPGNDEAMDAIFFYNDLISRYILQKKYLWVLYWFNSNFGLFGMKKDKYVNKKSFVNLLSIVETSLSLYPNRVNNSLEGHKAGLRNLQSEKIPYSALVNRLINYRKQRYGLWGWLSFLMFSKYYPKHNYKKWKGVYWLNKKKLVYSDRSFKGKPYRSSIKSYPYINYHKYLFRNVNSKFQDPVLHLNVWLFLKFFMSNYLFSLLRLKYFFTKHLGRTYRKIRKTKSLRKFRSDWSLNKDNNFYYKHFWDDLGANAYYTEKKAQTVKKFYEYSLESINKKEELHIKNIPELKSNKFSNQISYIQARSIYVNWLVSNRNYYSLNKVTKIDLFLIFNEEKNLFK